MTKLWIVDDNVGFLACLQLALADKYEVRTFHDPQKCLAAVSTEKENRPDIVLTDLEMPGMDGIQLIEALKKEVSKIKSYLLTANLTKDIIEKARAAGVKGWIGKMEIDIMGIGQWLECIKGDGVEMST